MATGLTSANSTAMAPGCHSPGPGRRGRQQTRRRAPRTGCRPASPGFRVDADNGFAAHSPVTVE
eukprot:1974798-Lingulodinium_polyedra.AAC.1